MKKILTLILVLAMVLSMGAGLAGCKKDPNAGSTGTGEAGTYTVTVTSAGGLPLEGIAVSVFADDTLADMKGYDETDEEGSVSIELDGQDPYAITLSSVPKGYAVEEIYHFDGTKAEIVLTSSVVTGENMGDVTLGLGDIMYDFTVTTPDGTEVTLSKMLEEKKMVLLNLKECKDITLIIMYLLLYL